MTGPGPLDAALEATWPAAETASEGPFTLRFSEGGGQRVTAATLTGPDATPMETDAAIAAMRARGQVPLFRVRDGQEAFDADLAARGYAIVDPTLFLAAPLAPLAARAVPKVTAYDIWPPLAIQREIWSEGGIGPDRVAVMARVAGPRTALFGRNDARPAATGFLALHDGIAMVHALEVRPAHRQHGLAAHLMAHAARWAQARGAETLAVAVTEANAPARALYAALGMAETGRYHYRKAP